FARVVAARPDGSLAAALKDGREVFLFISPFRDNGRPGKPEYTQPNPNFIEARTDVNATSKQCPGGMVQIGRPMQVRPF
ncbi:hypothetical protein QOZ34_32220, partial [Pseudomonas aeruginosa]|uniref:hypothetical protein n=1 Tax=Pseudomonas aeruginosa TaxID=287 RepID=UPI00345A8BFD